MSTSFDSTDRSMNQTTLIINITQTSDCLRTPVATSNPGFESLPYFKFKKSGAASNWLQEWSGWLLIKVGTIGQVRLGKSCSRLVGQLTFGPNGFWRTDFLSNDYWPNDSKVKSIRTFLVSRPLFKFILADFASFANFA